MTFRMRPPTNSNNAPNTSQEQKTADRIDMDPPRLREHRGRFIYHPARISAEYLENLQIKSSEEHLEDLKTRMLIGKPVYEKEELVYDETVKRWKLVPQSEMYKYRS